jgi:prepilin-type N-terminal cleavage/methylation domain-containing protein
LEQLKHSSLSTVTNPLRQSRDAFTLTELLVSLTALAVLVLVCSKMIYTATTVASAATKKMDSSSQVRSVFDRMAVDFAQMVRRSDVDYYTKSNANPQPGNDLVAFFSKTTGYYPSSSFQSPISLVAYRVNSDPSSASFCKMQRMGKGLLWNSASTTHRPLLFGADAIINNWAAATSDTALDSDYELIGQQIFRFEYFYILDTGVVAVSPAAKGMQGVTAVVVTVATVDAKSRMLLSDCQLGGSDGTVACGSYTGNGLIQRLRDFDATQPPSDLTTNWETTLNGIFDMPRAAVDGVRVYQQYFYLTSAK